MLPRLVRQGALGALALVGGALLIPAPPTTLPEQVRPVPAVEPAPPPSTESREEGCHERPLRVPGGAPPRLTCEEARGILSEVHARYAGPSTEPDVRGFPELVAGWLDPHGLWSAAPDAPLARSLARYSSALLGELRVGPESEEPCRAAGVLGAELKGWVSELTRSFEAAARSPKLLPSARAFEAFAEPVFQDDPVTRPARVFARLLGERVASFAREYPGLGETLAGIARERYLPELSMEVWTEVVLAAAVRAYVPLLDPHGAWAPFDEEWSLYSEDPGFDAGPRLWGEVTRTAVAVRVLSDALPPLQNGDLILAIDGIATAGMPLEQIEQLGRLEPDEGALRRVVALRGAGREPREFLLDVSADVDPGDEAFTLEGERVRYGDGYVLVVRISNVPEGLGDSLGRLLSEPREPRPAGVVLDLRGNGGGSTEAAASVLGLFLPGAALFPLSSRGRLVEVMRAAEPPLERRWSGPVAALVDGYTASAAEMLAGALAAYGRGVVLGRRTFGKGCIQEYTDDHTGRGVLRVTTLLYALPDGSAVQQTGITPDVILNVGTAREREVDVGGALPGYWGPDVRDKSFAVSAPWPPHRGEVGAASDPAIAAALRRLGTPGLGLRSVASRRATPRGKSSVALARP